MRVFISYSKEDVDLAESVAISLRESPHKVFFDRSDIQASESFDAIIRNEIARTDFLIFLASAESLAEGAYALTELGLFKKKFRTPKGRLLTVLVRGQELPQLPAYLRSVSIPDIKGNMVAEITAWTLECLGRLMSRSFRRKIPIVASLLILLIIGVSFRGPITQWLRGNSSTTNTAQHPQGDEGNRSPDEQYSPEVTKANVQWESKSYFRGHDFGTKKGQVFARVGVGYYKKMKPLEHATLPSEALVPISDESISAWSDTEIVLDFTEDDKRRLREARDRVSGDLMSERANGFLIDYQIVTREGKTFTTPHMR